MYERNPASEDLDLEESDWAINYETKIAIATNGKSGDEDDNSMIQ